MEAEREGARGWGTRSKRGEMKSVGERWKRGE